MTDLLTPRNTEGVNFQPKKYVGRLRNVYGEYPQVALVASTVQDTSHPLIGRGTLFSLNFASTKFCVITKKSRAFLIHCRKYVFHGISALA